MDESGIVIVGATSPTGERVTRALLKTGTPVAAVVRNLAREAELAALGAQVLVADVMDRPATFQALETLHGKYPILLNLIGGNPFADPQSWPDYEGVVNVTDAAVASGIAHYVLVTSIGTGASWRFVPESAAYIRPIIELKTRAEEHLKATGLSWTILKPGGLGPPDYHVRHGEPLVTENHGVRGLIGRDELAEVILRVLRANPARTRHRELYIVVDRVEAHDGPPDSFII